jgi:hypothetical protein
MWGSTLVSLLLFLAAWAFGCGVGIAAAVLFFSALATLDAACRIGKKPCNEA